MNKSTTNTTARMQIIGRGLTADILAWDEGYVLKLFHTGANRATVEREAAVSQIIHAAGLPVPAPGEIVELDGRYGLVYERINGEMMAQRLRRRSWEIPKMARLLAELHHDLHSRTASGLRRQRDHLEHKIRHADLDQDLKQAALHQLAALPDGEALCHGDFHPENILLCGGQAFIIDWQDATIGNPLADVARTAVIIGIMQRQRHPVGLLMQGGRLLLRRLYLAHYARLHPGAMDEVWCWLPVIAAGRLTESIPEKAELRTFVRRELNEV